MTSVVIAAHNEEASVGACLDSLLAGALPGEFDVTVVANGCSDATAEIARRRPGVRVIELVQASKPRALNAGDQAAVGFPRAYLDADMRVPTEVVRVLRDALSTPGVLATFPARRLDVVGRPLVVRAYFAINGRLPVFRSGLFGRGLIVLSEVGRQRFDTFPEMVADDLFLDSLFTKSEKLLLDEVYTVVSTPLETRDLVRRLVRVRRGNAAMRSAVRPGDADVDVRASTRFSWLRDVVLPQPWLTPAALVYVAVSAWAAILARRGERDDMTWGGDSSTRDLRAGSRTRGEE